MRVLVTGSRNWTDEPTVRDAIAKVITDQKYGTYIVIVHGDCPTGADRITREFMEGLEDGHVDYILHEPHPAMWGLHGKAAGPIRNQQMVDAGADICLAFPLGRSKGTRDCMRRAQEAGIPITIYEPKAASVGGFA